MAVDEHWRLYYSPAYLEGKPVELLAATLAHEVWHLLRGHHERMRCYPEQVANWASDAEINDDLKREGWSVSHDWIYPRDCGMPDGRTAEEYADALMQQQPPPSGAAGGDDQNGQSGQGTPSSSSGSNPYDSEEQQQANHNASGGARPGGGRCGSCATGRRAPWELPADDPQHPGMSDVEAQAVRQAVAREMRDRHAGKLPADIERWVESLLGPSRVDWRRELASILRGLAGRQAGCSDYTYTRPSRRQDMVSGGIILPAMCAPTPRVGIVVDTSGSIRNDELARMVSEAVAIVRQACAGRARIVVCDAAVHASYWFRSAAQVAESLAGGGGTDMRVGIAEAQQSRPDVIVVFTDGYTPWPDEPPAIPVVIGLVTDNPSQTLPAWAKVVRIAG